MILVIGALETIWSAHESAVWDEAVAEARGPGLAGEPGEYGAGDPAAPMAERMRRAALRDHEKLLEAIEAGDEDRAASIAGAHLIASGAAGAGGQRATINANLVSDIDLTRRSTDR
jgi:hypothetical protein